jgi:hypothetical protein
MTTTTTTTTKNNGDNDNDNNDNNNDDNDDVACQGAKQVSSLPSQDKHKTKCQAFSLTPNGSQDKDP